MISYKMSTLSLAVILLAGHCALARESRVLRRLANAINQSNDDAITHRRRMAFDPRAGPKTVKSGFSQAEYAEIQRQAKTEKTLKSGGVDAHTYSGHNSGGYRNYGGHDRRRMNSNERGAFTYQESYEKPVRLVRDKKREANIKVHSAVDIAPDLLGNYILTDGPPRIGVKFDTYTNKDHGKCSKENHWYKESKCTEEGKCSACGAPWNFSECATIKQTEWYGFKRWVMLDGEGRQHFYANGDDSDKPPSGGWMAYEDSSDDVTTKTNKFAAKGVVLTGDVFKTGDSSDSDSSSSKCPNCDGTGKTGWLSMTTCNECGGTGKFDVNLSWANRT